MQPKDDDAVDCNDTIDELILAADSVQRQLCKILPAHNRHAAQGPVSKAEGQPGVSLQCLVWNSRNQLAVCHYKLSMKLCCRFATYLYVWVHVAVAQWGFSLVFKAQHAQHEAC